MKRRMLSILLAVMMIMPLFMVNTSGAELPVPAASVNSAGDNTKTGIDYSAADVIVTGSINGEKNSAYFINLSKETFTVPADYKIAAYSTNGGTSWTAVTASKAFDNARLANLFASNITLAFTDKYESSRKRVPEGAVIVKFPKMNKRLSLSSSDYTVNYQLGADTTGMTTGTWLLTEKSGKTSVKQGIEIGVLNSSGKLDGKGYGRFYGADGSTNGIEIAALPASGKAVNPSYNIRKAPIAGSDGTYTAASKSVKITVNGQRAVSASDYKVDTKKKTIEYSANTYVSKDKKTELKTAKGTVDIAGYNGDVYLWNAPALRTPTISAMKKVSVTSAADGTLSYTSDTVTVLPESALGLDAPAVLNKSQSAVGIMPMANFQGAAFSLTFEDGSGHSKTLDAINLGLSGNIRWRTTADDYVQLSVATGGVITVTASKKNAGKVNVIAEQIDDTDPTNIIVKNSATWEVTVLPAILTLNQNTLVLEKNSTSGLSAIHDAAAGPVEWSSSNIEVAAVDNSGVVTAGNRGGSTVITAKLPASQGGSAANCTVTVVIPVTSVSIESIAPEDLPANIRIPIGSPAPKLTLKAIFNPSDATNQNITWSSSNPAAATVNSSSGIVTGVAKGTADITVTTEDGNKTSSVTVEVVDKLEISGAPTTANLAPPVEGMYYETTFRDLKAKGGTEYSADDIPNNIVDGYKWSVSGTLPNGLFFSNIGGVWGIRGTPTSGGTHSFVIRAADSQGFTVSTIEYKMTSGTPQAYTVVINKKGDNVQGDEVGRVGIRRGTVDHDGSPVTGGTVVTFFATEGQGYYIDKWEILVASPPSSDNYVPITGVDIGGLINEFSHPVTANMIVNVWYKKYNIARYSVYGGVGGTMTASSIVPTQPATNTPTSGFIYVKDNGDINFAASPAPGWDLYEWRYASTAAPGRPAREPQDVVRSDGKTWAETGLASPVEKYMLSTYSRIVVETEIVVHVEFVPRLEINTIPAPPRGQVDKAYTHPFTAKIGSEPVDIANIARWEILDIDASSPTGSSVSDFPFEFVDAKSGVLTSKSGTSGLTPGKGGLYTFYIQVTLNDENQTSVKQIFTIYIEDKFSIDYEIKTTAAGVNGSLYLKVGDEQELPYGGVPGTDGIRSRSGILEDTPVLFRAEPNDPGLYWAVWRVIDKDHADFKLYGTELDKYPAGSEAVLVDTSRNIINYPGFADENRNIYTFSINKNLYITVTFEQKPTYRIQFTAMDITESPETDANGGVVTAEVQDSDTPLYEGIAADSIVNTVRAGSKVIFTAYPNPDWLVTEWRLYNVKVANSDGTGAVTDVSAAYNILGSGLTCEATIVDHVRVVAVFASKPTMPVSKVTVNPTELSIGESGNKTVTASILPQAADQRVKWSIKFSYEPSGGGTTLDALKNYLVSKLGIVDPENLRVNEIKNSAGDIISYSYQTKSSTAAASWGVSQEIIRIDDLSPAQEVKVSIGEPEKYGDFKGLQFSVTAASAVNSDKKDSSTVTITEYIPAKGVDVQPETLTMAVGNDYTLKATVLPSSPPDPDGASNTDVTWSSSDPNIVFVDSNGKVTAINKGTATVTATTVDGKLKDNCVITVVEAFIELDKPNNYIFPAKIVEYTDAGTHIVRVTNKASEPVKVTVTLEGPHKDKFEVSPDLFENMPANSFNMFTVNPKADLPAGAYTAVVSVKGESVATGKSVGTLKFEVSFRVVKDETELTPPQSIKITVLNSPRPPVSQNGRATYILYAGETMNVRADKIYPENPDAVIHWKADPAGIVDLRNNTGETNVITAKTLGNATVEASYNPVDMIYIIVAGRPQIIMPEEVTDVPQHGVQIPGGSLSQAHLPNAIIGTPYNQTLMTRGFLGYHSPTWSLTPAGSPPLYWRVIGGLLPPGLTLTQWIDGTTAPIGANHQAGSVIGGTPTAAGSGKLYTFMLEAGEIVYYEQKGSIVWQAPDFDINCLNNTIPCTHSLAAAGGLIGAATIARSAADSYRDTVWITAGRPTSGPIYTQYMLLENIATSAEAAAAAVGRPICSAYERVTLNGNRIVLFAAEERAVRTMNIYVRTDSYFAATGLRITADKMTSATVKINGADVTENRLSIPAGTTSTVTPIISPANATVKTVVYSSSNSTAADIDSSGKITAKEAGTALITVTTADGNLSESILVTVTKVNVTGISLNTQKITVGVGGTAALTPTIKPSNASIKDITWSTSDVSVVSVDSKGKITGIKPTGANPVTITAVSSDNPAATASVQVTVSPLAVTGVTLKEETTLGIGDTETLLANVIPANASDKNVAWSSSNTAVATVATVSNTGVITGVAAGTATITVTTADGSYTAVCKVTVSNSYNIKLEQTAGGTVTMSAAKALAGSKINLSVSPSPGYYFVGWETSPADTAIVGGTLIMPAQNITVTPVFKQFTFMNDYIPPLNLDTSKPSYPFKFTSNILHNSLGISIRASELAELARRNPNFTIDIDTGFGIYQFPVNILSIIPDINGILSRNNVNVNEIVFNIIITDKKNDKAILNAVEYYMPPVSNIIASAVDFTVEIAKIDASGRPGNRIAVADHFTEKITRLIPLNPNAEPSGQQWGAYKYNPTANLFEFVPHVARNIDGKWYAAIMSNTNSIYLAAKNPVGFSDVAANQWYTPYIAKAASKRLIQGMGGGLYQPDTNITKAQFVQMVANALQLPDGTATPYSDVKATDWFYSAITRARSAGLLNKFNSSAFNPNQPITRGEMTVILAAALRRYGFAPNDEAIRRFQADFRDSVSPDNLGDAALVYNLGIMNGIGNGYYSPGGYTTRAQAATVQIRLLETLGFINK